MHVLEELLHPIPFETFRKSHFFHTPFASPMKARSFENFISWPLIRQILQGHANCWLPKQGVLPREPELSNGRLDFDAAMNGFQNGRTILIRHAEEAHPAIASVADDFKTLFAKPVDVQLYVTPKDEEGFHWHYDAEEVFVIQCRGEKQFHLRENKMDPWPLPENTPEDMKFERVKFMAETVCHLKPGDWL